LGFPLSAASSSHPHYLYTKDIHLSWSMPSVVPGLAPDTSYASFDILFYVIIFMCQKVFA
jgi:hypothetical protein